MQREEGRKIYDSFFYEDYPVDNIEKILANMQEVKCIQIYADMSDIPSEMQQFASVDSLLARDEVVIEIKTKRGSSLDWRKICNSVKQMWGKNGDSKKQYRRVKVHGKNENKGSTIFDTEFIRKKESILTELNGGGLVDSLDIFRKMVDLIKDVE